jgi:hypothetical protein
VEIREFQTCAKSVFKTAAIDHSAIPPRCKSGRNSSNSREPRPTHSPSVTASVTIGTAREDTRHAGGGLRRGRNGVMVPPRLMASSVWRSDGRALWRPADSDLDADDAAGQLIDDFAMWRRALDHDAPARRST